VSRTLAALRVTTIIEFAGLYRVMTSKPAVATPAVLNETRRFLCVLGPSVMCYTAM
jgi:hypothetical protein